MRTSLHPLRRTTAAISIFVAAALVAQVLAFPSRAEASHAPFTVFPVTQMDILDPNRAVFLSLEDAVTADLAEVHGVANDGLLTVWARDEIRAFMWARITEIIDTPAAQRTTGEQAIYDAMQEVTRLKNIEIAQISLDQYFEWDQLTCGYVPPPGFVHDAGAACGGSPLGGLFSGATPPSVDQFEAYGVALGFPKTVIEMVTASPSIIAPGSP